MRVAIYTRVSTSSKSRYGEALAFDQRPELQEEPLRKLAELRGWRITRVYSDRASGSKETRPALNELLADARCGQFDVLMVFRFDRLSRSALHLLTVVEELRRLGVDFVSHEQNLDTTTAMGKFVLTMFAGLAELERQTIRTRVQAGMEYAKLHGTRSGLPIGRPKRIFDRQAVVRLRQEENFSLQRIASHVGISIATVTRTLQAQAARQVAAPAVSQKAYA